MKKPAASIKKMGGPVSAKGKLASSQNAIKTGVTAKQLLNEYEYSRLHQLMLDLTTHYQSANPLVTLQIEKIARLQIQLERIQNAIDALYRQSEKAGPRKDKDNDSEMDLATLNLKLRIMLGLLDQSIIKKISDALFNTRIKQVFAEPPISQPIDGDDCEGPSITQESLLGAYLYSEASFYRQEMSEYLKDKCAVIANFNHTKELYKSLNIEVLEKAIDLMQTPDLEQSIITKDDYEFRQFNDWFERQLRRLSTQLIELEKVFKEKENGIHLPMPNYDELDRLMRYQATISRQLSIAVGELMVLAKQ